ncbi:MAG TPA: DNA repair protein RadC [Chthoniobacterales bacterium]|jgi:DNA repair protein RadC
MAALKIRELPAEDRPREKLLQRGASALTDRELLAILLRTGVKGANAVEVGGQLLQRYKSLSGLCQCSADQLAAIHGVGLAKAVQLAAAFELGRRLAKETVTREKIDSPELVNEFFGAEMRAMQTESLRVLLLDTRYRLIEAKQISVGSVNESIAHPREIFRPAIMASAYAVIVAHNHPSGDPTPSAADHSLTRRLAEVAELLQIKLLDHVIIGSPAEGRSAYFSFKEAGVI